MKQSDLSLLLSFLIWRRHDSLWKTVYLSLVLPPVIEVGCCCCAEFFWACLDEFSSLRMKWLNFFGFPGACPSLSCCRLADHFSKVSPGRQSMWKGRRRELVSKHSHELLLFKGFLVEHRTQQIPPHMLTEPPCFQLLFHLFVSSKRLTLLWERTLREQVKFKQHPALKHSGYGREHLCHCILNRHLEEK